MTLPLVPTWRNEIRDSELDAKAKHVGLTLSTWMSSDGVCYPSRPTQAEACGYSVRTIDRAIARLERAGLLVVSRGTGRGNSNQYAAVLNSVTGDAFSANKGRQNDAKRATESLVKGDTGDTRSRKKASEDVLTLANARERPAGARKTGARTRAAKASAPDISPELLAYDQ
jgi:hypothetical protein